MLRRRLLFSALYLSEGAPIGFLWWYLPVHLEARGVPLGQTAGLVSALALVWSLKVLWAPVLDRCRGRRWGYGAWMLTAQLGMGLTLLPLLVLDPVAQFELLVACCLAHAVCAATQDVAIDAMVVASIPPGQRGAVNGWMQAGMYAGRSVFGGFALAWALGALVPALVATIWIIGLVALASGLLDVPAPRPEAGHVVARLVRALGRRRVLLGLLFAVLAGAGFEGLAGLMGPYLLEAGYTKDAVAPLLGIVAVAALALGSLGGGRLADAVGARRATGVLLPVVAVLAATFVLLEAGPPLVVALAALYLAIGAFVTATYALFMDLTEPVWAATQFTAFMAATNLCESWATKAMGTAAPAWGWPLAVAGLAVASLLALPLLGRLRRPPAAAEDEAEAVRS